MTDGRPASAGIDPALVALIEHPEGPLPPDGFPAGIDPALVALIEHPEGPLPPGGFPARIDPAHVALNTHRQGPLLTGGLLGAGRVVPGSARQRAAGGVVPSAALVLLCAGVTCW